MPRTYRKLQHWDNWLSQHTFGQFLLDIESETITELTKQHFGKHVAIIGSPHQSILFNAISLPCHCMMSPIMAKSAITGLIETSLHELPISGGSVDLVVIPHTLEFIDNPRQLLSEACRIVKPEGLIIVIGFNPYSLLGLSHLFLNKKKQQIPWNHHRINAYAIKTWLQLADFHVETHLTKLFIPSMRSSSIYKKLHFLESISHFCLPKMGGIYIVMARAKVIPLIPIKLKWKQQLGGLRLPNSMTGHIARHQK